MDGNSSDEDIISINGPLAHADDDVDGMILAVAAEHPEGVVAFDSFGALLTYLYLQPHGNFL
jgi:hypothetical protein